ncbi:VOC family protein [Enterococcus sp. AZ196]|uniref:VOC family protein n=1 Tax=Enterococcus sp. AZ196 TaxID=2774659 RepID=UPI003D28B6FA
MVTPYLVFNRQCEEAMTYYEKVFSGEKKEILRYTDYVPEGVVEDVRNYVLHGKMTLFETEFTFADEFSKPVTSGNQVHLTVHPSDAAEGKRIYNELSKEGEVFLPPTETFYSPLHTTIQDKFGIVWNIIVI